MQKYGEYEATKSEVAVLRETSAKRLAEFASQPTPARGAEAPTDRIGSKDKDQWIVGTNWAGWSQWYNDKDGYWRGYSGGAFIVSFAEGGRCFILKGDDDRRTVDRSEATWRQEGDRIIISKLNYLDNVVLRLSENSNEVASGAGYEVASFRSQSNSEKARG